MAYFPEAEHARSIDWLAEQLASFQLAHLRDRYTMAASLILSHDPEHEDFTVLAGDGVPPEPFNGSAKLDLADFLQKVVATHPKPHIHSCAGTAFAERCERLSTRCKELRKIVYYPCFAAENAYTFLGMFGADVQVDLASDLELAIQETLFTAHVAQQLKQSVTRLKATEVFMKEIGHDLASSVQTTVSKLRLISENRVQGIAVQSKAKEAEAEVKSAWRIADSLGIVGDPGYSISNPSDFDLVKVVKSAVDHHRSEASEKDIKMRLRPSVDTLPLWGEDKALEIAVGHLLSNAVKYSFGGSEIEISLYREPDEAVIGVTNKGVPLPSEPERKLIWDFGVRGENAKELHVNGSGIGLYTARKVVLAHGGRVLADELPNEITRFRVFLPYTARLKQKLGMIL